MSAAASPAAASPGARVVSPHFARRAPSPSPSPSPSPQLEPAAAAHVGGDEHLAALDAYLRQLGGALPPGWRAEVKTRATGASAGHCDTYFVSASGARFRSRAEVARSLGLTAVAAGAARAAAALPREKARRARSPPPKRAKPAPAAKVLSPFFTTEAPSDAPRGVGVWEPPPSPYGLIQETLFRDPWKVLVACILLNKTTSDAVRRVIWELFELIPTPEAALAVPEADIARIIKPLGLTKRAAYIQRMSAQYLGGAWRSVAELAGCGQYATDAYALFCTGDWRAMAPPADKELIKYFRFLQETDGKGRGLSRDPPPKGFCIAGL